MLIPSLQREGSGEAEAGNVGVASWLPRRGRPGGSTSAKRAGTGCDRDATRRRGVGALVGWTHMQELVTAEDEEPVQLENREEQHSLQELGEPAWPPVSSFLVGDV